MRAFILALMPLVLVGFGPAWADDAKPQPGREKERQTLEAFGAAYKTCQEWTDGCAVCLRHDDGSFACSLPGIACLPTNVSCRNDATAKEPKTPAPSEPTAPKTPDKPASPGG